MITWTLQLAFLQFDIRCWTVETAVKIILEPDTSPGRIGLLNDQLLPRTAFWDVEMWVRPEVLRRDQINRSPHPASLQCLMWLLARNLNPHACHKDALGCWFVFTCFVYCTFHRLTEGSHYGAAVFLALLLTPERPRRPASVGINLGNTNSRKLQKYT